MPWLEKTPQGRYHVGFRFGGLKYKKALRTRDERTANARVQRLDENLRLLEGGLLTMPANADVAAFLLSDGKLDGTKPNKPKRKLRTLGKLSTAFLASIPEGALEESTINGMRTHLKHLRRVLGASFSLPEASLEDLQSYVESRGKDNGIRGKRLSPSTIKKELTTLRTLWNWAKEAGHLSGQFPSRGLRYPKTHEKPPFQTLAQIEQRIARGHLSEREQDELWGALFLTTHELFELLRHVKATSSNDFLYPMFVLAAHTGARRSEILRSRLDDIDFASGVITIREKKRVQGSTTTRSSPLSPLLKSVLSDYMPLHPGGKYTFMAPPFIERSKRRTGTPSRITRDQAHDYFKRAVRGTSWSKARGWHVFRHSFCSNCAPTGIDQRVINA
ncbi:MAG: site-specific integrase [Planctomycetota bacterium]